MVIDGKVSLSLDADEVVLVMPAAAAAAAAAAADDIAPSLISASSEGSEISNEWEYLCSATRNSAVMSLLGLNAVMKSPSAKNVGNFSKGLCSKGKFRSRHITMFEKVIQTTFLS